MSLCSILEYSNSKQLNNQPTNAGDIEDEILNISAAMTLIHLTQAIYFQPNPTAIMAEDLMHWVNRLDSHPDPAEGDEIMRRHPACHHPSYWPFLHKYIPPSRNLLNTFLGLSLEDSSKLQSAVFELKA